MTAFLLLAEQLESQARTLTATAQALREWDTRPVGKVDAGPRTLSLAEVAERLSCAKSFVRTLIAQKELKAVRLSDRALRVAESDVAALIRRRSA